MPTSDPTHTDWLAKLPGPLALLSSGPSAALTHNGLSFLDLAFGALTAQGCRRVGLIFPLAATRTGIASHFVDLATDHRLAIRDAWVKTAADPLKCRYAQRQHRFGYERMHRLWAQAERPDGLIVCPDSVATGVILALAEPGVKVPGDLRLVVHRNRGDAAALAVPGDVCRIGPG